MYIAFTDRKGEENMLAEKEMDDNLRRLTPMEEWLKAVYERGEEFDVTPYGREHMTNLDYELNATNNIQIRKHYRYSPPQMHDHEFIELVYIYSGVCHQEFLFQGKRTALDLKEGDAVIIPPGTKHALSVFDDSVAVNILINRHTFDRVFLRDLPGGNLLYRFFQEIIFSGESSSYLMFALEQREDIRSVVLQLMMEDRQAGEFSAKIGEHLLSILFLKMIEYAKTTDISSHLPGDIRRAAPMMLYIQQHYRDFSLERMAEEFHYSRANVNRIFRKYTGTTVLQYVKEVRLQQGERLLVETEKPVEEIAQEAGYQDTSYFIEQFKRRYGKTPLQYRREMEEMS